MEEHYVEDGTQIYLVLEGNQPMETGYEIKMLSNNDVPGLLPMHTVHEGGLWNIYYPVGGLTSLQKYCNDDKLEFKYLRGLIFALRQMADTLDEYLLDAENLILDPKEIFLQEETGDLYFCYYPGLRKNVAKALRSLLEFFLIHIDHKAEVDMLLTYGLYQKCKDSLCTLKTPYQYYIQARNRMVPATERVEEYAELDRGETTSEFSSTPEYVAQDESSAVQDAVFAAQCRDEKPKEGRANSKIQESDAHGTSEPKAASRKTKKPKKHDDLATTPAATTQNNSVDTLEGILQRQIKNHRRDEEVNQESSKGKVAKINQERDKGEAAAVNQESGGNVATEQKKSHGFFGRKKKAKNLGATGSSAWDASAPAQGKALAGWESEPETIDELATKLKKQERQEKEDFEAEEDEEKEETKRGLVGILREYWFEMAVGALTGVGILGILFM